VERGKTLEVRIREAKPEDYTKIKEISRRAFVHELITEIEYGSMEFQLGEYFENIKKYSTWDVGEACRKKVFLSQKIFVAEDRNGEVIGYTGIERQNTDGRADGAFWLNWTAVEPRYQGCCVGKKVILEAIRQVKALGGLTLNVKTSPFLDSAHKTYERLGFKITGRIPNYYEKGCDVIIYSLDLTSIDQEYYKKLLGKK